MNHEPMDDPRRLWGELLAGALRRGPRLEAWWGTCRSCGFGASDAGNFFGATWSYCGTCRVRWFVSDLPPELELEWPDTETAYAFAFALSQCTELDPLPGLGIITPTPIRRADMKRETNEKPFGAIDPQRFQRPRELLLLRGMTPLQRVRVTALTCSAVTEHSEAHPVTGRPVVNVHRVWERIRECPVDDQGTSVSEVLRKPELAGPTAELQRLIDFLLELREERALLEQRLELLDGIEAAFAAKAKASSSSETTR